jgi:Proteasome-substrate-size regulator, mid region
MAPDGPPTAPSSAPTPLGTPFTSGMNTPRHQSSSVGDYLAASLGKLPFLGLKSYIGGSKALDSLVKLIASTESFFHPSNSGAWTGDVCLIFYLPRRDSFFHGKDRVSYALMCLYAVVCVHQIRCI